MQDDKLRLATSGAFCVSIGERRAQVGLQNCTTQVRLLPPLPLSQTTSQALLPQINSPLLNLGSSTMAGRVGAEIRIPVGYIEEFYLTPDGPLAPLIYTGEAWVSLSSEQGRTVLDKVRAAHIGPDGDVA